MNKWIVSSLLFIGFLAAVVWETSKLEKVMGAEDYLNLGIEKGSLGLHEEAIDLFRKGLNENPNLVTAYFFLGNAYGNAKRYKEALNAYREGIQLNRRHKDVPQMEMNIAWIYMQFMTIKQQFFLQKKQSSLLLIVTIMQE